MNYFGTLKSIASEQYEICGLQIEVYYYLINLNKAEKDKFTPNGINIMNISEYEGIYHPVCKIRSIPELTIDELGVKKEGSKYEIYNYKTKKGLNNLTPEMLVTLIICGLHSLKVRLDIDIKRRTRGIIIDNAHINASKYTRRFITYHVNLLKNLIDKPYYLCISKSINKNKFITNSNIEKMYSMINEDITKLLNEYNKIIGISKVKKNISF